MDQPRDALFLLGAQAAFGAVPSGLSILSTLLLLALWIRLIYGKMLKVLILWGLGTFLLTLSTLLLFLLPRQNPRPRLIGLLDGPNSECRLRPSQGSLAEIGSTRVFLHLHAPHPTAA